jgi:hypothetical protein
MRDTIYEKYFLQDFKKYLIFREGDLRKKEQSMLFWFVKHYDLDVDRLKNMQTWADFDRELVRKLYKGKFNPISTFYD